MIVVPIGNDVSLITISLIDATNNSHIFNLIWQKGFAMVLHRMY